MLGRPHANQEESFRASVKSNTCATGTTGVLGSIINHTDEVAENKRNVLPPVLEARTLN